MIRCREAFAFVVAMALVGSAGLLAQKRDDAQKKEIQAAVKLVDDVVAGRPVPSDLPLVWAHEDYLKAAGNKDYVPFSVTIDPTKVTGTNVAIYWRVVLKTAATAGGSAPLPAPAGKKDAPKHEFAYEDVSFVPVMPGATTQRISRSFTVPAGSYDVFVVAKEVGAPQKNAPPSKTSVIKQSVTVPDFWNGEFTTSSVILAQRIDPLPAPLTPQQQVDRPYALGQMEIVPVFEMKFSKKTELSTFMLIYNPKTDTGNKPDVSVEYNFYSKSGGAEKFFNKTNPQNLNGQTLPLEFDMSAGHQLQTGQAVPLASFPEGEYRLEIKITDKVANKSITRDVNFSVTAS